MAINITLIVLILIIGAIVGIVLGALYTIGKIWWSERKVKKDYEQGKNLFEVKGEPSNKKLVEKIMPSKPEKAKEESNYKDDLKKFKEANKELERLKIEHEQGKITYPQLKEKFEYYQNQSYYKNILR